MDSCYGTKLRHTTQKYVLGNPEDPESTVGPMASVRFADKVRAHIHDAGKSLWSTCVFQRTNLTQNLQQNSG
jgi:acyl-CoA reductase-like NAD-dependent aldehyde dehydrogenase